jgi:uncharacterized membrane protein
MLSIIVGLILYLHHTGQKLRVGGLINLVGDELRNQIDDYYPAEMAEAASGPQDEEIVVGQEPGLVVKVEHEGLVATARRAGCVLEMVPMMGDFVPVGTPLFLYQHAIDYMRSIQRYSNSHMMFLACAGQGTSVFDPGQSC